MLYGGVTLEVYMLHIYNLPLDYVKQYIGNHTIAVIVTLVFCVLIAYVVSIVFNANKVWSKIGLLFKKC